MNSFSRMLCNYSMDSCSPRVDACSSAIVFLLFFFFSCSFFLADSMYRPPSLYSLMCVIGCLLSIVPHAGEILLELLAVDNN
jgi:hypothetical protein